MHFHDGRIPQEYQQYIGRKVLFLVLLGAALVMVLLVSISLGAARIPLTDVARSLVGMETTRKIEIIVWNIRLPQAFAAMVAGAGLALAGAVMQSILRNPLGSPFTLGIAHAAAFGAAVGVMVLGGGYSERAWSVQYRSIRNLIDQYGVRPYAPRPATIKEQMYTK